MKAHAAKTLVKQKSRPPLPAPNQSVAANRSALDHATRLIHRVCCLAGSGDFITDLRTDNEALRSAIERHDTAAIFDWLMAMLSYQGISDQVAHDYITHHGNVSWHEIERALATGLTCPKLQGYWRFYRCGYHKSSRTCTEPEHIAQCSLPTHPLRNGRLNQTAYALYLFIRDIADEDLVAWIDGELASAGTAEDTDQLGQMREALLAPLRHVYGVSDKVLSMTLSVLLMAAPKSKTHWASVGTTMIAIDTLVHNFLHRTGILRRLGATHPYGPVCYGAHGCLGVLEMVANQIDAREFHSGFPQTFPRFVQHAIWRYCAENGLDVCNGNRIEDASRCENVYCQVRRMCDRIALHSPTEA